MKVLLIPEDQQLDRYIVQRVGELLFSRIKPSARIEVLPEPRLQGASQALNQEIVAAIVRDNPMVDLFLIMVDRDCDRDGNEGRAETRESEHDGRLMACCAHQEVEVWMLSGHKELVREITNTKWSDVRKHCDPKEAYADPVLDGLGRLGPGAGRKAAMKSVTFDQLMTCEELQRLFNRLLKWAEAGT